MGVLADESVDDVALAVSSAVFVSRIDTTLGRGAAFAAPSAAPCASFCSFAAAVPIHAG